MWQYRERAGKKAIKTSTHDNTLEVTWTLIPTALVAVMFWVGFKGFLDLKQAPEGSYEVELRAFQWGWDFVYPNGANDNVLHVPANEPVRLVMYSDDVLHSLFIPAFRVKQDIVPGRYTSLWFEATQAGEYDLFCTEYCGTSHSAMITKVVVHETREAFDVWLAKAADYITGEPPVEAGATAFRKKGCANCHAPVIDANTPDAQKYGPAFIDVSTAIAEKKPITFEDGTSLVPDENYIRESILMPNAKRKPGYEGKNMSLYAGRIKDEEINVLIAWIKSLHSANQ